MDSVVIAIPLDYIVNEINDIKLSYIYVNLHVYVFIYSKTLNPTISICFKK
jgi:hypothetical protein